MTQRMNQKSDAGGGIRTYGSSCVLARSAAPQFLGSITGIVDNEHIMLSIS